NRDRGHASSPLVEKADPDRAHAALRHVDRLPLPGGNATAERPLERHDDPDARDGRRQEPNLVPPRHAGARRPPSHRSAPLGRSTHAHAEAQVARPPPHRVLQHPAAIDDAPRSEAAMPTKNADTLPVTAPATSARFFGQLGFPRDERLASEKTEAVIVSEDI